MRLKQAPYAVLWSLETARFAIPLESGYGVFIMQQSMYVGVDVGKEKSMACFLDSNQNILDSFYFAHTLKEYENVASHIRKDARIIMEPTGVYGLNLFVYLKNLGFDVRFCNTNSSNFTIRSETNGMKVKTDSMDAKGLALHSIIHWNKCRTMLPQVMNLRGYENTLFYLRISELLSEYLLLNKLAAKTKNKVDCLINLRFPEMMYVFSKPNSKMAMKFMCLDKEDYQFPAAEIARFIGARDDRVEYVVKMKEYLDKSLSSQTGLFDCKVTETRQLVRELEIIEKEKVAKEKALQELIENTEFKQLYFMKGLDTANIATLIVNVRDIKRFFAHNSDGSLNLTKSLSAFRRFCGFSITSNSSGKKEGTHKLACAGNMSLRNLFFMMALTYASLPYNNEITEYYHTKCKTMIKKKAILKTANHLCAIVFHKIRNLQWDFQKV